MRAHSHGGRALAAAVLTSSAAIFGASYGCGESFSSSAAADAGAATDASSSSDALALSAFCESESHNSPMFDLCDSFDDRTAQDVVGRWTEVRTGAAYDQIALTIDDSASVSKPASLRIHRATSGAEAGHFLGFEADVAEGQTWRVRGRLGAQFTAPEGASGYASFAPVVLKLLSGQSTQIPVAHAYLRFDASNDGGARSASAASAGTNPFSAASTTTYRLLSWDSPRLFTFEITMTRSTALTSPLTVTVQLDSETTTFQLDRAAAALVNPRLQIQVGGFTASGGWDFHADDIVITHN
jgi:hypothetical protein